MHIVIADRTVDLALELKPDPRTVLDIGCGTGYLLRQLSARLADSCQLVGIDPAPLMIDVAQASTSDDRLRFEFGVAEQLPFPEDFFDLVVSTTSFDHWSSQEAGLRECARVLKPGGRLVLVDQFSLWLLPSLLVGRRGKARTTHRADRLLVAAGFNGIVWHDTYAVIIRAVSASI